MRDRPEPEDPHLAECPEVSDRREHPEAGHDHDDVVRHGREAPTGALDETFASEDQIQ